MVYTVVHTQSRRFAMKAKSPAMAAFAAILIFGVAACGRPDLEDDLNFCLETLQQKPTSLLFGTEGSTRLCRCTTERLQARFPDASERWVAYSEQLNRRLEDRGVVGLVADSVWLQQAGTEMAEFVSAEIEIAGQCTEALIREWSEEKHR